MELKMQSKRFDFNSLAERVHLEGTKSKGILKGGRNLWNVLKYSKLYLFFYSKTNFRGFTKNQTSSQHSPSRTNVIISLMLE